MPSTSPSARTDCPSTASRGDGQQTRHESGQPCPMPQESTTRPAPRPDGHAARRPYAASLPAQIEQTEPAGEREDIRRGRRRARKETGRKSEDLRPLAYRIAAQVIKASNPARSQPDRSQRRRPAGTPPATVPNSSPVSFSARFQFCFWRVCRTPARFRPSADEQRHPARLPGRHRHRGSLHIFAPAPFLTKRLSTSTLSRTPHIPIFHSGTISTIPQQ